MKKAARILSYVSLGITLVPASLFFGDKLTLPQAQLWMLLGTILWFATAPLWMEHKLGD